MNYSYFLCIVYCGTCLLKSIILSSMTPGNCEGSSTFCICYFFSLLWVFGVWGTVGCLKAYGPSICLKFQRRQKRQFLHSFNKVIL